MLYIHTPPHTYIHISQTKGVRNLHVSALASPKAITMLYEVKPGA